jgi:hypothetical protein
VSLNSQTQGITRSPLAPHYRREVTRYTKKMTTEECTKKNAEKFRK